MKPQLLKVPYGPAHSFGVRKEMRPNINNRWHYHNEVELIHFHKGHGTQFIGNNVSDFEPGDILLIGSNLPHYWKYDEVYEHVDDDLSAYSTVIHFYENFVGEHFLSLPECRPIKHVLEKAKHGLLLKASSAKNLCDLIEKSYNKEGLERIIALIECLLAIYKNDDVILLSSTALKHDYSNLNNKRINDVYKYSLANFNEKIKIDDVASIVGLTVSSFCRYFKNQTGKTYSQFLLDIRIDNACKMLIDNKMDIKRICYESGFTNFSTFYQYFKKSTGKTPQGYKQVYR